MYTGNMGERIKRKISVTAQANEDCSSSGAKNEPSVEHGDPYAADAADNVSSKKASQDFGGPIIFQYGNNNVQIGSIESLTINNG